jgi:hypothetical protein
MRALQDRSGPVPTDRVGQSTVIDVERKRRVVEVMKQLHLDAFICGTASDILFMTGYWPVIGPSVAIFTAEGDIDVVLPEDEVELAAANSEAVLTPYKPSELAKINKLIEALSDPLRQATARLGLSKASIGCKSTGAYNLLAIFRATGWIGLGE